MIKGHLTDPSPSAMICSGEVAEHGCVEGLTPDDLVAEATRMALSVRRIDAELPKTAMTWRRWGSSKMMCHG
jgi:hypothetical protein